MPMNQNEINKDLRQIIINTTQMPPNWVSLILILIILFYCLVSLTLSRILIFVIFSKFYNDQKILSKICMF